MKFKAFDLGFSVVKQKKSAQVLLRGSFLVFFLVPHARLRAL
jgi:hypothetical protein